MVSVVSFYGKEIFANWSRFLVTFSGNFQCFSDAGNVNLLGGNINNVLRNAEAVLDASKEAGLCTTQIKVSTRLCFCHQNAGQNRGTIWDNQQSHRTRGRVPVGPASFQVITGPLWKWPSSVLLRCVVWRKDPDANRLHTSRHIW